MCVLVKGTWVADTFLPEDEAVYQTGVLNIQRFVMTFAKIHESYDHNWETTLAELGILHALPSSKSWITEWERCIFVSDKNFTMTHYTSYLNLLSILRHTMVNGDLFWTNRTVVLDTSVSIDWFVAQVVK